MKNKTLKTVLFMLLFCTVVIGPSHFVAAENVDTMRSVAGSSMVVMQNVTSSSTNLTRSATGSSTDAAQNVTSSSADTTQSVAGSLADTTQSVADTTTENQKKEKYQIKYVLSGGSNPSSNPDHYFNTDKEIALYEAKKSGYQFEGWYLDKDYKEKISKITGTLQKDLTLYAKFSCITYQIQYETGTGELPDNAVKDYTIENNDITLFVPTRAGYRFEGWYDNIKYEGNPYTKIKKGSYGNKCFYAKWSVEEYRIDYDVCGGIQNEKNKYSFTCLSPAISFYEPTRKGYVFEGWYLEREYRNKIEKLPSGSMNHRVLYAKWKKVTVGKPGRIKLKQKNGFLEISYKKVSGAKGYELTYYQKGKSKKKVSLNGLKYTLLKCKTGKIYCVKVRAYKYDSENRRVYGKYSKVYKKRIK